MHLFHLILFARLVCYLSHAFPSLRWGHQVGGWVGCGRRSNYIEGRDTRFGRENCSSLFLSRNFRFPAPMFKRKEYIRNQLRVGFLFCIYIYIFFTWPSPVRWNFGVVLYIYFFSYLSSYFAFTVVMILFFLFRFYDPLYIFFVGT